MNPPEKRREILSADIGGTNSRFAHFAAFGGGRLEMVSQLWLKTSDADSFDALLGHLRESEFPFDPRQADVVVVAVAGPVSGGISVSPPQIPWGIDIARAGRKHGFRRALLINDFVAQAYACISPVAGAAERVLDGTPVRSATIAVIGAGTGLGKAILVPQRGGGFVAAPSEGAHACFPFAGREEHLFQRFLIKTRRIRHVTGNHVVSGSGLAAIHAFLTGQQLAPEQVVGEFPGHPETLAWFARFYGRACRNFALETLARGGLYIAGGIAARNPRIVRHDGFRSEFRDSDPMGPLLAELPVFLIRDENSGLWGGAMRAVEALAEEEP